MTLRVTSRISTGASLRERSFLWTHRKLTSEARTGAEEEEEGPPSPPSPLLFRTRSVAGTAVMNPTSLRASLSVLMPTCHSLTCPGGVSAHFRKSGE